MLEISNTEIVGWEHAIRGMRNPLNSWDKSDSYECDAEFSGECPFICEFGSCKEPVMCDDGKLGFCIGHNDFDLMNRLSNAGNDHAKFLRMIVIYTDIVAPLYWWKEFDTYKVGTVRNSCSTMHKIHSKEFTLDDFSCEHLSNGNIIDCDGEMIPNIPYPSVIPTDVLETIIHSLNVCRNRFIKTEDKNDWWQMIQLLPSSYNQRSTVMMNYQVLKNIYHSRRNHKLDEWHTFCDWIESLPYSEIITGKVGD